MRVHFVMGAVVCLGLAVAPTWGTESIRKKLLQLAEDEDARVRFQTAFSLGETKGADKVDALSQIALKDAGDRWVRAALLSSVTDEADDLFSRHTQALRSLEATPPGTGDLLRELARVIGARGVADETGSTLRATVLLAEAEKWDLAVDALTGLRSGLELGGSSVTAPDSAAALTPLMAAESEALRNAAFELSGRILPKGSPELESIIETSLETVLNPDGEEGPRAEAAALLRLGSPEQVKQPLMDSMSAIEPEAVELAAMKSLQVVVGDEFPALALSKWADLGPAAKTAALDALLSRKAGTEALLAAVEKGDLAPGLLDAQRQTQILNHPDAAIANRAQALYAAPNKEEDPSLYEKYRASLDLEGDAGRGARWHEERCAQCHKVGEVGRALGPDWASVRANSKESLLISLLYPNRVVAPGFTQYVVETVDGDIYSGLLASTGPTSVVIRTAGGEDVTLLRRNIESIRDTSLSMMPAKLEENLTLQDMADLLEFMKNPPEGSNP